MKITPVLLFCFFISNVMFALPVSFNDALRSAKIKAVITGNPVSNNPNKSSHTGKCLLLKVSNPGKSKIECKLESAYHFSNLNDKHQDIINVEDVLITLLPGQERSYAINGYCGEKTNGSPSEKDTFRLDARHDQKYIVLAAICAKFKNYTHTGQQAFWCYTDNAEIENIYDTGADTVFENELVRAVANSKGLPVPARRYAALRVIRYPVEIDTMVKEHVEGITTIGIYLTDADNKILETLFPEETERRTGTATYTFFYRGVLPKGMYYVKMKKNNQWIVIREVKVEG